MDEVNRRYIRIVRYELCGCAVNIQLWLSFFWSFSEGQNVFVPSFKQNCDILCKNKNIVINMGMI